MATIVATVTYPESGDDRTERACVLAVWAAVTENDTCNGVQLPAYPDRSVQVAGSFTSISIEGSNIAAATTYAVLNDTWDNELTFTAAGIDTIAENPLWIRPKTPVGASSSVTVYMLGKK